MGRKKEGQLTTSTPIVPTLVIVAFSVIKVVGIVIFVIHLFFVCELILIFA